MLRFLLAFLLCSLPPLVSAAEAIPLRDFFEHRPFVDMQLSPDGKHLAATYEDGSEVRLAVMNMASKKITASFHFGEQMHVLDFFWGNNERVVMQVGKVTGNLDNFGRAATMYAANIDGAKREKLFEVGYSGYSILSTLRDDPKNILIAKYHFSDRKPKAHKLNIYNGKLDYIGDQPSADVDQLIADNAGSVRMGLEYVPGETLLDDQVRVHVKHGSSWRVLPLKSERKSPSFQPLGFSADNSKAYFLSNYDVAENDRLGVFEYDFATEKVRLLYRHPEVDVSGGIYGHDGDVLGVIVRAGIPEAVYFDEKAGESRFIRDLQQAFPNQVARVTSFNADGSAAIARVSSDTNPGDFYLFEVATRKASFLASSMPKLRGKLTVKMEPVEITARDGLKLHALLSRPTVESKNLPLIVNVHGGPFGVTDFWGFNPEAQFLASRGYAVLQVNYRGSGNRGDDFERAGFRQWGYKMQDDVTDSTLWAIQNGIADAKRICIYGGSYGGYAALWGVIKEPDLYRCAIGYVGVYDMPKFFSGDGSDASKYSSRMDEWLELRVGSSKEELEKISPAHNVSKIKADLLIVHGENDVRVPMVHYRSLTSALKDAGIRFESMLKPEGHGFYQVDNRVDFYTKMLAFFELNIGSQAAAK